MPSLQVLLVTLTLTPPLPLPDPYLTLTLTGVPPVMGLYTAFFPMLIFSLLTTSRHMCVPRLDFNIISILKRSYPRHYGPDALSSLLVGQIMIHPEYIGEDKQYLASVFAFIVPFP